MIVDVEVMSLMGTKLEQKADAFRAIITSSAAKTSSRASRSCGIATTRETKANKRAERRILNMTLRFGGKLLRRDSYIKILFKFS